MKFTTKQIQMTLLALGTMALVGCSSKSMVGEGTSSLSSGAAGDSLCNGFASTAFSGRIKDVSNLMDLSGTQYSVEILLSELPSAFYNDANYVLQAFPGQDYITGNNQDTVTIFSNNPTYITVVNRQTGATKFIDTGLFNIDRMREALQMPTNPTAADLSKISLKIQWGDKNKYPIINLSMFNSTSAARVATANMLLPAFTANPNNFVADHPGLRGLQQLHPMIGYAAQNWSTEQYQSRTNAMYCF